MGADFFAKKAAEHAQKCTPEENQKRAANGRKSNVVYDFGDKYAYLFLNSGVMASDQTKNPQAATA